MYPTWIFSFIFAGEIEHPFITGVRSRTADHTTKLSFLRVYWLSHKGFEVLNDYIDLIEYEKNT